MPDADGRTEEKLVFLWDPAPGADRYDLALESGGVDAVQTNVQSGGGITGLHASRDYSARIRAVNGDGASDWSGALPCCTLPPKPGPPRGGETDLTDPVLLVQWDCSVTAQTGDEPQAMLVDLEIKDAAGGLIENRTGLPVTHLFRDAKHGGIRIYRIRLTCPKPRAPDGVNRSDWSTPVTLRKEVFAKLRIPAVRPNDKTPISKFFHRHGLL